MLIHIQYEDSKTEILWFSTVHVNNACWRTTKNKIMRRDSVKLGKQIVKKAEQRYMLTYYGI